MEVIGVLEEFPCDSLNAELVLMVCENGKVFAYEDEHMHLVAKSLKELFDHGLQFPGIKRYYRGQAFEHMVSRMLSYIQYFLLIDCTWPTDS